MTDEKFKFKGTEGRIFSIVVVNGIGGERAVRRMGREYGTERQTIIDMAVVFWLLVATENVHRFGEGPPVGKIDSWRKG